MSSPVERGAPTILSRSPREDRFWLPTPVAEGLLERLIDRRDMRVVVVVAHPDDEAIGAGALLRTLPRASVVHVTDGAPRDVRCAIENGFSSRGEYARARREELVRALALAGIPASNAHCSASRMVPPPFSSSKCASGSRRSSIVCVPTS